MIYSTKELLEIGETEYSIRKKVANKELYVVERGIYSDISLNFIDELYISKKYPNAIFTGLSAFYIYDLTTHIPDCFYVATEQHSFPIRRKDVAQSYQDKAFFEVGATYVENVRVYDLERTLIELIRLKEKYPREIYYEVLGNIRRIKNELNMYKINTYLSSFSNGDSLAQRIKEALL